MTIKELNSTIHILENDSRYINYNDSRRKPLSIDKMQFEDRSDEWDDVEDDRMEWDFK